MPAVGRPAERGDLYATAEIAMPKELSPEARKAFEELRKQQS
jgi:DnaJ-class molecular chaperone